MVQTINSEGKEKEKKRGRKEINIIGLGVSMREKEEGGQTCTENCHIVHKAKREDEREKREVDKDK